MKKSTTFFAFLGFLILILVITNPNTSEHKALLKDQLNERMEQKLYEGEEADSSDGLKMIGSFLGKAMISGAVSTMVTVDSYVVCSTSRLSMNGKSEVIGLGILGNVFLVGDVKEVLEDGGRKTEGEEGN